MLHGMPRKAPGPFGGPPGSPISASFLLHDTLLCIASSSLLDLDDPGDPRLTEKWRNSSIGTGILSRDMQPLPLGHLGFRDKERLQRNLVEGSFVRCGVGIPVGHTDEAIHHAQSG
jgi:hypothetical protein